jgi:putative tryptophan/tyrosine transport system substrate-binding protein
MGRREFISLLGSTAVAWPLAVRAQQNGMPVIGFLSFGLPAPNMVAAFRQGLAEAGYIEGKNVTIEFRSADRQNMPRLADDLVARKVDVIVTTGSPSAAIAAKDATSAIPIVFSLGQDPVQYDLVTRLSRPGGNVTGITTVSSSLAGKRLNLLLELIPQAATIAYLSGPSGSPIFEELKSDMLAAGRALGRKIVVSEVRGLDFETAFTTLIEQQAGALLVGGFTVFGGNNRVKIVERAARHKIAAMYPNRPFVVDGGLMSYGADQVASFRQLALNYVGPILKGAKPADLPVQQPTKFELVINVKTAKALGLTIPRTLYAAASELIE